MELFDEKGCLTDEGLQALTGGQLDEMGKQQSTLPTATDAWTATPPC